MTAYKKVNAIAIDGPAGSGKSTISKLVAERLGYVYIDTGAMYRSLTLKVMRENIDFAEEEQIADLSEHLDLKFMSSGNGLNSIHVISDNEDVSEDIRRMEVTVNVKHVARISAVRSNLVKLQRQMAADSDGAVMEGRDIGTVVLPDAGNKFYVDASFDERVRRRLTELLAKGHTITCPEVADDLKQRDHADTTRKVGPLIKADDAIFIDTTDLSIDEVVEKIVQHVNKRDV